MLSRSFRRAIGSRANADFSHAIIGGGVVGIAVAHELQKNPAHRVVVLEQHPMLGMETTSRNSEVIHAGIYYPPNSLKAKLCIRGKQLIYRLPRSLVPHQQCGKWIVAQSESEAAYLDSLLVNASLLQVETERLSEKQTQNEIPDIRASHGALHSLSTGIISAHHLTQYFHAQFDTAGGTLALNTRVADLEIDQGNNRYIVYCIDSSDEFSVTADNIVNCAGLHAAKIANMLLPLERHFQSHFAKGNYYLYLPKNPLRQKITKLIYPCPQPHISGLGTHLTFDLSGAIRFGPDLEWLDTEDAADLDYLVSQSNLERAKDAIATYFPLISSDELQASYSGIRPKIHPSAVKGFSDFYIKEEDGFPGFVNMLGIESPGLTSSFAIAEYVRDIYGGKATG